ncbi:hypothetical protein [Nocardia tengchongensis]|uniref:hypothetical protein n=1 Tax=Nocardia tengchongensis TaxID=2055889 RepID=UPI00368B816B
MTALAGIGERNPSVPSRVAGNEGIRVRTNVGNRTQTVDEVGLVAGEDDRPHGPFPHSLCCGSGKVDEVLTRTFDDINQSSSTLLQLEFRCRSHHKWNKEHRYSKSFGKYAK